MDSAALRAMQAPLKERYRNDPQAAVITLKARGTLDDAHVACKVETGRALAVRGCIRRAGAPGSNSALATCCSRRSLLAPV